MRKNIAVILAGGTGARSGLEYPKQFLKVAGKEVLAHTVDIFQQHDGIDEIAIVANGAYIERVEDLVRANQWTKVKRVLHGGEERYESSLAAITAYADEDNPNLIFHDAVRPLLSTQIVDNVLQALTKYPAVDTVIPSADTVVEVDPHSGIITNIPNRKHLRRGQTPQAFHYDVIKSAYEHAVRDSKFQVTDDCGVVKTYRPDVPIQTVAGEESNMKLTYPEDIYLLEKLFQVKTSRASTTPLNDQLKHKVAVVFGGSYGIGQDIVNRINTEGGHAFSFSRSENAVDIRDTEAIQAALKTVREAHGKIDYIVCSAAILRKEPLMHMDPETIDMLIDVNFRGMINVSLAAFPYLRESRGQLLHFTSSSYTRGRADYSIYSASKAAVVNFVQAISQEWEPSGVRVNCINPARTRTPMRVRNFGQEPEGTLLEGATVAEAAVKTLVSKHTGQVIDVTL